MHESVRRIKRAIADRQASGGMTAGWEKITITVIDAQGALDIIERLEADLDKEKAAYAELASRMMSAAARGKKE